MRGQGSIEFIIIFAILLLVIGVISVTSIIKTGEVGLTNFQREVERVLDSAGSAINTVFLEGDGFETNITLPERIMNFNYTITLSKNYLSITSRNISFTRQLLTNVTGTLSTGPNRIRNEKGEVKIL